MSRASRVILTTIGSEGHVSPFVSIGRELVRRGLDVYLITHGRFARRFPSAPIHFIAVDDEAGYIQYLRDGELLNRPGSIADFFRAHVLPRAHNEISAIGDLNLDGQTVLITAEMPGLGARIGAERFRIPLVTVFPAPGFLSTRSLFEHFLYSTLTNDVQKIRNGFGLPAVASWENWWRSKVSSLALWPAWFSNNLPSDVKCVDFVWDDDRETDVDPGDLRLSDGFILITGGTGYFAGSRFFETVIEASNRLQLESLVVCAHSELLPGALPGNVQHVRRVASLAAVMQKASVIVHHGGMGTVGQAIAAGRPQVVLAAGGDRPENAKHVERLGLGLAIPKRLWNPDYVASLIRRTMRDSHTQARCVELSLLAQARGHVAACNIIVMSTAIGSQETR